MSGRSPLYKKYAWINMNYHPHLLCTVAFVVNLLTHCCSCCRAYVFFSSPIQKDLVAQIKRDSSILPRIGALSEVTLAFSFLSILYLSIVKMKKCSVGYSLFVLHVISRWIWSTSLLIPRYPSSLKDYLFRYSMLLDTCSVIVIFDTCFPINIISHMI